MKVFDRTLQHSLASAGQRTVVGFRLQSRTWKDTAVEHGYNFCTVRKAIRPTQEGIDVCKLSKVVDLERGKAS